MSSFMLISTFVDVTDQRTGLTFAHIKATIHGATLLLATVVTRL